MINDSGARREFETGAVRDIQDGKGRCDLLPLDVVQKLMSDSTNKVLSEIENFKNTGAEIYLIYSLLSFIEKVEIPDDGLVCDEHISTTLLEVSKHFEEGAKKYGEYNWQKGIPTHCYIDSAVRHFLKYIRGDKDEPHDRAFVWNILCCMWTCKNKPELNDYPRKEVKEVEKEEAKVERCCETCMHKIVINGECCKTVSCLRCEDDGGPDDPYPGWEPRKEGDIQWLL